MAEDFIKVRGAREHNLRNINVDVPRDKLVVITGVSGSGKSSLAFDTIYAEGQRRYVESLSAYARQFLGRMDKPDVDHIEGLSPAISIDQKGVSRNPRSTVGTVTEVYDYLRLLFARAGRPHCHNCGRPVARQSVQQITDSVMRLEVGARILVLAPIITHKKGEHLGVFENARTEGFVRVRVDGDVRMLEEEIKLAKTRWHDIEIVVDRLVTGPDADIGRLSESLETALRLAGGTVIISIIEMITVPPASLRAVSIESESRPTSASGPVTSRSTTISISCQRVLASLIASSSIRTSPSTRTRTKPSVRAFSNTPRCSPFLCVTIGESTSIRAPASSRITESVICWTD